MCVCVCVYVFFPEKGAIGPKKLGIYDPERSSKLRGRNYKKENLNKRESTEEVELRNAGCFFIRFSDVARAFPVGRAHLVLGLSGVYGWRASGGPTRNSHRKEGRKRNELATRETKWR